MARFFLPCTRALAVRCLGQHGGWWRTPKHEHAEPRRSVGWAHDMELFRCDGATDRDGIGGSDRRSQTLLRSARACGSNFKFLFLSCKTVDAHDHFFAHLGSISTGFRQNPATRGTGAPSSERWEESAKTRLPRTCGRTHNIDSRLSTQAAALGVGSRS